MKKFMKVEQVGAGGQGAVWRARVLDSASGEFVALKYMHVDPISPAPADDLERFRREIRAQASLDHPGIVKVLARNTTADTPWYAMPWATGTLRSRLAGGPPDEAVALHIFSGIVDAMAYAHAEGVLHRDLKPENVLFYGDDNPVICDFGLSRRLNSGSTTLTVTAAGMGTIQYSAPEQFTDAHSADARADIYALGKILLELFTGVIPFPTIDLNRAPSKYRYIIQRCTEHKPEDRYQTVSDLAREVSLLTGDASGLRQPSEEATELVTRLLSGDPSALPALSKLLIENGSDEGLYTQFVPYLPKVIVEQFARSDAGCFAAVIKQFDDYAAGSHPFSYTDVIADFLESVYEATSDLSIQRLVLERLLALGHSHNRWHVGDVFVRVVQRSLSEQGRVLMVAGVLRRHPAERQFVEPGLRRLSLPAAIISALE